MKWNYAIMNPPYYGSLELKFLEKVIHISDDVVTVQPISWLQDPLNMDKKHQNLINMKIVYVNISMMLKY